MEEIEDKTDEVMRFADINNDKRISLPEFISYCTKNKGIMALLNYYGIISKDDFRKDFGGNEDINAIPDCDSDLEYETDSERTKCNERTEAIKNGIEFIPVSSRWQCRIRVYEKQVPHHITVRELSKVLIELYDDTLLELRLCTSLH